MKIFVVEAYAVLDEDDSWVEGAFSTIEKAEQYIDSCEDDDLCEYNLYELVLDKPLTLGSAYDIHSRNS